MVNNVSLTRNIASKQNDLWRLMGYFQCTSYQSVSFKRIPITPILIIVHSQSELFRILCSDLPPHVYQLLPHYNDLVSSGSRIGTVYEDVTTDVLGQIGAWQWMVTVFSTTLMATTMFNQYEDMFLLKSPRGIVCTPPIGYEVTNISVCYVVSKNSSDQIPCAEWNVKLMGLVWLKKTWIMSCDHDWKFLSTAMICRLGVMFGYVLFGLVADSFGRKKAMMLDVCSDLILRLSIVFCDSENWFKLLVFIRSLLGSANNYMGLILICEIASNRWRSRLSLIVASPRLLAAVCMVPLARTVANSETFTLIACVYNIVLMLVLRWTPESPQWLLYNNKTNQAETTLYTAARKNRIRLCSDFKIRPVNHRAYYCVDQSQTCLGVLSTHNTRILTVVSLIFWSLCCNSWSILYANVYSEDQNDYFLLNVIFFVCVIGCLTVFLSLKWKMRHLLMLNILGAGVSGTAVMICRQTKQKVTVSMLYSVALAARLIANAITITIAPRLFAINIRATLLGCCQAAGQLGAIIGYLVTTLKLIDSFSLGLLDVIVTVTLITLCLIFPDVDCREMPDVLQDMDYFSELSKPLRWATQKTHSPSHEEVELRNHSFGSRGRPQSMRSATSEERAPAQPIGFTRIWRAVTRCTNRCCHTLLCKNKD